MRLTTKPHRRLLVFVPILLASLLQASLAAAQLRSPQEVVNLFMKVYGTHRMREILPYTLPAFREGMKPQLWLNRTQRILRSIGYVRLEGVIQSVVVKYDEATIVVGSRIRTKAATGTQTEIYHLRLTDQGWKLLDIEVEEEVLEKKPPGSVS